MGVVVHFHNPSAGISEPGSQAAFWSLLASEKLCLKNEQTKQTKKKTSGQCPGSSEPRLSSGSTHTYAHKQNKSTPNLQDTGVGEGHPRRVRCGRGSSEQSQCGRGSSEQSQCGRGSSAQSQVWERVIPAN